MTKKVLSILMALVLCCGFFAVAVRAEDTTEPEVPAEPAYTPVEYKIEDIVARIGKGDDVFLMPTDIILLPVEDVEEPEDPETPVEVAAAEDPAPVTEEPAVSSVLIVEYLPGSNAASRTAGVTKFLDFQGTKYAVRGMDESTDFVIEGGLQKETKGTYAIDYANADGYAFKNWRVESIYSGKEFNRIVLSAQWDVPQYQGWKGFKAMLSNYAKTFIDYIIAYLSDLMNRISMFFA